MPNHCSNTFRFTGSKEDIAELKKRLIKHSTPEDDDYNGESVRFDFNGIIPMPSELEVCCAGIGNRALQLLQMPTDLLLHTANTFRDWQACRDLIERYGSDWQRTTAADLIALLERYPEEQAKCHIDLPLGRKYLDNLNRYGHTDWYSWSCVKWGTKWNAYECVIDDSTDETVLSGSFETAWSPPEGVFRAIAEQFPTVEITARYLELGVFFAGSYFSDGLGGLDDFPEEERNIRAFATEHFGMEFDEEDD